MTTVAELKRILAANDARWAVNARLREADELPEYSLGGSREGLAPSTASREIDFPNLFAAEPGPPHLLSRRLAREFLTKEQAGELPATLPAPAHEAPPEGGAPPSSVDWRNRWGIPWITTIRDQDGCQACWAFAATALVEAMTRIEHAVWTHRSEGDVHKGMGATCPSTGGANNALNWIAANGIADPDCFAWTVADIAYTPTSDRSGRTVKIPAHTSVGNLNDQKDWLDTVGPLVTWFEVWNDFFALGNGIYQKQDFIAPGVPNAVAGGHFMLVVGYDDSNGCWIVKNSWGTGWGDDGYGRIAYGETGIDTYSKTGLTGTDPDPWTKRRMHAGAMIESGMGPLHCNFELLATCSSNRFRHWWRDGQTFAWARTAEHGNDVAGFPTLTATTYARNWESVHRTTSSRLHHWYFDRAAGAWCDGGVFGPPDATGAPGFMQANYGAPGNFEVVVSTATGQLNHWWRDNAGGTGWHDGGRFGSNVAHSGPTLLQSRYGNIGNFELVCVLGDGRMQHWWRNNDADNAWHASDTFGEDLNIDSPPCMIEGQYGAGNEFATGNFELCVASGGKVHHWWRDNGGGTGWHHSASFGHDVAQVVALIEGSYGFNLEVVVVRTDHRLQHYWRDIAGWHEGAVIGLA